MKPSQELLAAIKMCTLAAKAEGIAIEARKRLDEALTHGGHENDEVTLKLTKVQIALLWSLADDMLEGK